MRWGAVIVGYGDTEPSPTLVTEFADAQQVVLVVNPRYGAPTVVAPTGWQTIIATQNRGFAAAVNLGLDALDGSVELVLVCSHELTAEPGLLQTLALAFDDPEVAVAGPLLTDRRTGLTSAGGRYLGPGRCRHQLSGPGGSTSPLDVDWVDGACLSFRWSMLGDLRFDEATFLYVEEVDFCLTARDRGFRIVVMPGARAAQIGGAPSRPGLHSYLIFRNHVRLALRRLGARGAARASVAGGAFAAREAARMLFGSKPGRRFHALQAKGAIRGVAAGIRGEIGPPPPDMLGGTDVTLVGHGTIT